MTNMRFDVGGFEAPTSSLLLTALLKFSTILAEWLVIALTCSEVWLWRNLAESLQC